MTRASKGFCTLPDCGDYLLNMEYLHKRVRGGAADRSGRMRPPTQQHCVSSADRTRTDRPLNTRGRLMEPVLPGKYSITLKTSGAHKTHATKRQNGKIMSSTRNAAGRSKEMHQKSYTKVKKTHLRLQGSRGKRGEGEADSTAREVCERPELLFRGRRRARLYISQAEIRIGTNQRE